MSYYISLINNFAYIISPIFYKIVYMSLIGSIIGLLIILVKKIFDKKISPKWQGVIWIVFVISLICPFAINTPFSIFNYLSEDILILNTKVENLPNVSFRNTFDEAKRKYNNELEVYEIYKDNKTFDIESQNNKVAEAKNDVTKSFLQSLFIDIVFPYLWVISLIMIYLIYVISYIIFLRKTKPVKDVDKRIINIFESCKKGMKVKRKINLVMQEYIKAPAIFGIFNVKILINEKLLKMTDEEISYVFMHELAHYKRKDNLLNMLLTLLRGVYAFNPCILLIFKYIRKDLEAATDEVAVKYLNEDEKKMYLKTLINVSLLNNKFTTKVLSLNDDKNNLNRRIDMVKLSSYFNKNRLKISVLSVFIILFIFLVFLTNKMQVHKSLDIINSLKKYEYTYMNDYTGIQEIAKLLPFSNYLENIEINRSLYPQKIVLKYSVSLYKEELVYNNLLLFSLIPDANGIIYDFGNSGKIEISREECENICKMTLKDIDEYINYGIYFGSSSDYKLTLNNYGERIFVNPQKAFRRFLKDYDEEIEEIRVKFNLNELTMSEFESYMSYGLKGNLESDSLSEVCKMVSNFLEIYSLSSTNKKATIRYPMKDVKVKVQNVDNNVQSLGIVANNALRAYFENFYGESVKEDTRLTKFVPLSDRVLAGDINEFAVSVKYSVTPYDLNQDSYTWGELNSGYLTITSKVMLRIKKVGDEISDYYISGKPVVYSDYVILDIGENVSTQGLKEVKNAYVEEKIY